MDQSNLTIASEDIMKRACAHFLFLIAAAAALAASPGGLPFIRDHYDDAVAKARQANLPIFVEVWAPW